MNLQSKAHPKIDFWVQKGVPTVSDVPKIKKKIDHSLNLQFLESNIRDAEVQVQEERHSQRKKMKEAIGALK